jgi:hypothetical protein
VLPKAALLQVRGDWGNLNELFRIRSTSSEQFCWLCDASQSPGHLHFHDCDVTAGHRQTLIDHGAYMSACAISGDQPSNLFRAPGLQLHHLAVDSMHAADLGVWQDAIGSLLFLEIDQKSWSNSRVEGLRKLNEDLGLYYSANRHKNLSRVTPLSMSQLKQKDKKFPYLKAKAAGTRHLIDFALLLARRHRYGGGGRQRYAFPAGHRLAGREEEHLALLESLFAGMAQYKEACEPFSETECRDGMILALKSLSGLHKLWTTGLSEADAQKQPFHMRPKAHALLHLVLDQLQLFGSPARSWCYRDEDFVGVIKKIASRTMHPATMERRVSLKLRLLSGLLDLA